MTLENMVRNAKIIDQDTQNKHFVSVGAKVTIQELPDGDEETYPSWEAPSLIPSPAKSPMNPRSVLN